MHKLLSYWAMPHANLFCTVCIWERNLEPQEMIMAKGCRAWVRQSGRILPDFAGLFLMKKKRLRIENRERVTLP
ncbi:MAG: hypothetical protein WB502_11660 [Thermoactinomyces sp.]